jgi:hypothetical protein
VTAEQRMYMYDVGNCDIIAVHLDSECLILSRTSLVQSSPKGIVTVFKKLLQHMGSCPTFLFLKFSHRNAGRNPLKPAQLGNLRRPKTYKRREPTHRMNSTGLFSLIRLSVPALTAFFSPHQLSAIDPGLGAAP